MRESVARGRSRRERHSGACCGQCLQEFAAAWCHGAQHNMTRRWQGYRGRGATETFQPRRRGERGATSRLDRYVATPRRGEASRGSVADY